MSTIKIIVTVGTNMVGSQVKSEIELDKEDWEGMSEEQREEMCAEQMFQMIEWDYDMAEGE